MRRISNSSASRALNAAARFCSVSSLAAAVCESACDTLSIAEAFSGRGSADNALGATEPAALALRSPMRCCFNTCNSLSAKASLCWSCSCCSLAVNSLFCISRISASAAESCDFTDRLCCLIAFNSSAKTLVSDALIT